MPNEEGVVGALALPGQQTGVRPLVRHEMTRLFGRGFCARLPAQSVFTKPLRRFIFLCGGIIFLWELVNYFFWRWA